MTLDGRVMASLKAVIPITFSQPQICLHIDGGNILAI
jgi:hypothetical protein